MDAELAPKLIYIRPAEVAATAPFLFRFSLEENGSMGPKEQKPARMKTVQDASSKASGDPPAPLRVLKPLILQEWDDEPIIIDGHRRMHFAHRAGLDRIPALVYPKTTPKHSVCGLALSSAMESAGMSGVEKALAAFKITYFMLHSHFRGTLPVAEMNITRVPSELLHPFSRLFDKPVSERWLLRCFQVLTARAEELDMLHSIRLPIDHLIPLFDLDSSERQWLLNKKESAAMSAAEMRKIAQLLIFARAKPGFSLDRLAAGLEGAQARPIDGSSLIGLLKREIYPELCARERNIAAHLKSMELPAAITIRPPENLEGNSFSCYFTFSSSPEFRRYINLLMWAGGDGKIKAILDELSASSTSEE